MRTPCIRFLTLISLVVITTSCGPSKELTRTQALELLKAAPPGLIEDVVWPGALWNFQGNGDKDAWGCTTQKRLAFGDRLTKAGIITQNIIHYPRYDEYRPGGTRYEFRVSDQTYAESTADSISFVMGKARVAEVTGIKQDGATATVEASIVYDTTPIFEALVATETAFVPTSSGETCKELFDMPELQQESFLFERYDDGWRLKGKI